MHAKLQGLHEAGYKIVTVGHSLGAGAAALLTMMLKSRFASFQEHRPPCLKNSGLSRSMLVSIILMLLICNAFWMAV